MATKKKARKSTARQAVKKSARKPAGTAKGKARAVATRRKRAGGAAKAARKASKGLSLSSTTPGFTVNDIQKSIEFYRDVLGFEVKERWEHDGVLGGAEMKAGRVALYLGQDDWKKGRDRVKGVGFRIYCETSQDLDAIVAPYFASVKLSVEKGPFPAFEAESFLESGFTKRSLSGEVRAAIEEFGIRNCALLTIAPTGTNRNGQ